MEPGTAAILVLSAITGISGYGAMKLNARRGASIDEEVQKAIGDAKAIIAATEEAKVIAEKEVQKLTDELNTLKKAEKQLKSEKDTLSKSLESASELEKTYRGLSTEVFKEAIQDFIQKPAIQDLGDLKKVFEPLLSRFSLSRGTADSLYRKVETAVGPTRMLPRTNFDALLLESLKIGPSLLEKRRADQAEKARIAKEKSDAEAAEKAEKARLAKAKADAETQAANEIAAAEAAELRKAAIEKAAADAQTAKEKAAADAQTAKEKAAADAQTAKEKAAADAATKKAEAATKRVEARAAREKAAQLRQAEREKAAQLRKTEREKAAADAAAKKAAKDKGSLTLRTPVGGMRKKKLRTRRGVKQNVRRTRRSKNRSNRTDTYSSRRSEVDASGDELGL